VFKICPSIFHLKRYVIGALTSNKGLWMQSHLKYGLLTRFIFPALLILAIPVEAASSALPKAINLEYAVTKDNQPFATVKEQYQIHDGNYTIKSVTKGIGIYALLGERVLTSNGKVTKSGLKPMHFELHQGHSAKRSLVTEFDWQKNKLFMRVKGDVREADLVNGSQDLASYAYQFMYQPATLKNTLSVSLTTGKTLRRYDYIVQPATITVAGKPIKTLHLTPIKSEEDKDSIETKEFWLAKSKYYLPVKILVIDEDGLQLEQTLTKLNAK